MRVLCALMLGVCLYVSTVDARDTGVIMVRGNKLYDSITGERFFIKGMTYEYAVSNDEYDEKSKEVIAKSLKGLKFNSLRVYNINPDKSYDHFMNDMAKMGVYVMVAASPDNAPYFDKYRYGTLRKDLGPNGDSETCYPAILLEYGKKIARNFAQFNNTLGIIIANEIMQETITAAACVKQYVADLKNWMRANGDKMRTIPVAFAAADSAFYVPSSERDNVDEAQYKDLQNADEYNILKLQGLLCGDKMVDGVMQESIDMYLINEYRWCSKAKFDVYERFLNLAQGIPIVMGFGEYGCKHPDEPPREWNMVEYLYGKPSTTKQFTEVFSGGYAYSYGQANLAPDATFPMFTGGSQSIFGQPSNKPTEDYQNLKQQFDKHIPFVEKAEWDTKDKCSWVPSLKTKVHSSNKRVGDNGWVIDNCRDPVLLVKKSDTWITPTRNNAICDDEGNACPVKVTKRVGTTDEELCNRQMEIETGGKTCDSKSDCSGNGRCKEVNGNPTCVCEKCYTGRDCSILSDESGCKAKDPAKPGDAATPGVDKPDAPSADSLSSNNSAPTVIFLITGSILLVVMAVFVVLFVIARKRREEIERRGQQLQARTGDSSSL